MSPSRSTWAAPFAPRSAEAIAAAGFRTIGQLAALTRDQLGDRLPSLSSAQLDGVSAVLVDRAGASA